MRTNVTILAAALSFVSLPALADRTVCVSVTVRGPEEAKAPRPPVVPLKPDEPQTPSEVKTPYDYEEIPNRPRPSPPPPPPPAAGPIEGSLPIGQNPVSYLKRLIEHFVTHERGFIAVPCDCQQKIDVELYPLREGWTVFARYTGTGREERVDFMLPDELSQFAERVVIALLYDRPISTTILRDTVLRADSKRTQQRIRGTNHFELGVGAPIRFSFVGVPTAQSDGTTSDEGRVFWPFELMVGYRGKFESWGLEARFGLVIAPDKTGLGQNSSGGAIDYGGNVNFTLHFLRYLNPRGLSSWYLGAGGSFEVLWFYQIDQGGSSRSTLASGGFSIEALVGVEFMRASKAQFFLQAALILPAYMVEIGDHTSHMNAYFPGVSATLGMLF
jgi:hypothetical protein